MLLNKSLYLFLLSVFFIAFQCHDVENPHPPGTPEIVNKSKYSDFIERGIDAIESQDAIIIQWEPNSEKDLEGYYIYRGSANSENKIDYAKISTISVNDANPIVTATEYVDYDVLKKIEYFYYIQAFNQSKNVSDPSDTVSYKLAAKPNLFFPLATDANVSKTPKFTFSYSPDIDYGITYFIIKVTDVNGDSLWCYDFQRVGFGSEYKYVDFNTDHSSLVDTLTPGEYYKWKIDAVAPIGSNEQEIEGAESNWVQFKIKEY